MMINMSIIRNRLATLIQYIKTLQNLKIDSRNKSQNDRNSNFEFRLTSTKQRGRRNDIMSSRSNQINISISEN